jgi:hypothetical protein
VAKKNSANKSNKARKNNIHAERMRAIKPYVDFNYNMGPGGAFRDDTTAKRKIKKYFDEYQKLTTRPNQLYKSRSSKQLKAVQQYSQLPKGFGQFKVAFIPANNPVNVKFDKDTGDAVISDNNTTARMIMFDQTKLAKNPEKYVENLLVWRPENSFVVMAGEFEIPRGKDKATLPRYIKELTEKYVSRNHHYSRWLFGVRAYDFKNQRSFLSYLSARNKAKTSFQKKRRRKSSAPRKSKSTAKRK